MTDLDATLPATHRIRPDINGLFVSVEKINATLLEKASNRLSFSELKQYIYTYGLHQLRAGTGVNKDEIHKHYLAYIDLIHDHVCEYILHYPQKIVFPKKEGYLERSALQAWWYWSRLTPKQQKEASQYIIFKKGPIEHYNDFIDLRFLLPASEISSDDEKSYDEDESHNDYDIYDEHSTQTALALQANTIYQQRYFNIYNPKGKLTLEEVALAYIDYLVSDPKNMPHHNGGLRRDIDKSKVIPFMDQFVDIRLSRKVNRDKTRTERIINGASFTVLLKRIRQNPTLSLAQLTRQAGTKRKRVLNADFPDLVYSVFLSSALGKTGIQSVLNAPHARQRHVLKLLFLEKVKVGSPAGRDDFVTLLMKKYLPPYIVDCNKLYFGIFDTVKKQLRFDDKEYAFLTEKVCKQLKRIKGLAPRDLSLLQQVAFLRAKNQMALPRMAIAEIESDTLVLDLYLASKDIGITTARMRALLSGFYLKYLPKDPDPLREDQTVHDILLNFEKRLLRLLSGWSRTVQYAPVINKIISLITAQLGGSQGNVTHAFENWHALPTLAQKEKQISESPWKNLREVIEVAKFDPVLHEKVKLHVAAYQPATLPVDDILRYAYNAVDMKAFHAYLEKLLGNTSAPVPSILNGLSVPISKMVGGITLEILPYDHLVGCLGVAAPGVCIGFNGFAHHEHRHPAVANLIIRSDSHIFLWGLLIRAQNKNEIPTYVLNNLQGRLPSAFAKHKTALSDAIVSLLGQLGDVYTRNHGFNAINLIDPEKVKEINKPNLSMPFMRLDFSMGDNYIPEGATVAHRMIIEALYRLPCTDPAGAVALHTDDKKRFLCDKVA